MGSANVVAVIPARYNSTRFPGKPLVDIAGTPLVVRVAQRAQEVLSQEEVLVATDDQRIMDTCEANGIRATLTSPECLTGTDRVWEATRTSLTEADIILNIQGDEPLFPMEGLEQVVAAKRKNPNMVVNAMAPITRMLDIGSPNVPKVVVNEDNELCYISRAPIPYHKSQTDSPKYMKQVCIYAFSRDHLRQFGELDRKSRLETPEDIEVLRFLDLGIEVLMTQVESSSHAVDTPEDVRIVEEMLL